MEAFKAMLRPGEMPDSCPFLRGSGAAWNSPESHLLQTIQRVGGRLDTKLE